MNSGLAIESEIAWNSDWEKIDARDCHFTDDGTYDVTVHFIV